ncbi:MAG: TRAFAC clade GTPase domain-containing protein [Pseudonocardiaceae bacterium]
MAYQDPQRGEVADSIFIFLLYLVYIAAIVPCAIVVGIVISTGHVFYCYLLPMFQVATSRLDGLEPPVRQLRLPARRDPALPQYFFGPASIDIAYMWQLAVGNWHRERIGWQRRIERWCDQNGEGEWFMAIPPAAGIAIGLVLGVPAGVAATLVLIGVQVVVTSLLALVTIAVAGVLRAVDSTLLWLRHIRMRCLACFERMPYPAYDCPSCNAPHWDIRPGRFGIIRRVCSCGTPLPTVLLLGTADLPTRCPFRECGAALEHRPGKLREEVLPIFGATGAGKTRITYGLVAALLQEARRPGVSVSFADRWTTEQLEDVWRYLRDDQPVNATPPALQRGCVLRVRSGRSQRLLQFFDAAGERFYSLERSSDLLYLGSGRTFLLVIDPLSVNEFWLGLSTADRDRLTRNAPTNIPQPRLVYEQTVERITELRGEPGQSRLAVVFSRADVLGDHLVPIDREEDAIARWAEDRLGLGGLLRNARFDFKEVTLFSTAAVVRGDQVDESITALLHWTLSKSVPSDTELPAAGVGNCGE